MEVWDASNGWRYGPEMREKRYGGERGVAPATDLCGGRESSLQPRGTGSGCMPLGLRTAETDDAGQCWTPREGVWSIFDFKPLSHSYSCSLWGASLAASEGSLYICGGVFREIEESLSTVIRLDLPLGRAPLSHAVK